MTYLSTYPYILICYHINTTIKSTICPRKEEYVWLRMLEAKCKNFFLSLQMVRTSWEQVFLTENVCLSTGSDMINYTGQILCCLQGTPNSCLFFKDTQLCAKVKGEKWMSSFDHGRAREKKGFWLAVQPKMSRTGQEKK